MSNQITYHILNAENAHHLIGADIFDNPVDQTQLDAFVNSPGHILIFAMEKAKAIGMASGIIMLHPDKQPMFFINEVGVNDDMRRQGIGAKLSHRLLELARERACKGIWLATEPDNIEARALYRKLAGRETEGIVVYDWDGAMDD
jgi:ribosomal protein S18 acetylase RimI-like enzyme